MSTGSDAIDKRVEKLRNKGVELGPALTDDVELADGTTVRGYYDGIMMSMPGISEAWFKQDFESKLVLPEQPPPIPPTPTRLVNSIDVSNYQNPYEGFDLAKYLNDWQIEYCIVRIPQSAEPTSLVRIAHRQIEIVLENDTKLGAYFWLYRDVNIDRQVADVTKFLEPYSLQANLLWPDIEPYQTNSNLPNTDQIKYCNKLVFDYGYHPGMYTGPWVWALLGHPIDPEFYTLPLWSAEYNNIPTLESATLYGGWTSCAGHQYTSSPIDRSVFDSAVLGL